MVGKNGKESTLRDVSSSLSASPPQKKEKRKENSHLQTESRKCEAKRPSCAAPCPHPAEAGTAGHRRGFLEHARLRLAKEAEQTSHVDPGVAHPALPVDEGYAANRLPANCRMSINAPPPPKKKERETTHRPMTLAIWRPMTRAWSFECVKTMAACQPAWLRPRIAYQRSCTYHNRGCLLHARAHGQWHRNQSPLKVTGNRTRA